MKFVYLNPLPNGFEVRLQSGARGDRRWTFPTYEEAARFANTKMGKRGCVVDATRMRRPANVPTYEYAGVALPEAGYVPTAEEEVGQTRLSTLE